MYVLHWDDTRWHWDDTRHHQQTLHTQAEGHWTPVWLKGSSAGIEMTHILRTTLATLHCRHSLFSPNAQAHGTESRILIRSQKLSSTIRQHQHHNCDFSHSHLIYVCRANWCCFTNLHNVIILNILYRWHSKLSSSGRQKLNFILSQVPLRSFVEEVCGLIKALRFNMLVEDEIEYT